MGIKESFIWYQKKIGTYDKQQWETTIEQKILNGLNNIPMRNTKPNTDLIDLDLVRGSSFTKAKPQLKLVTVLKQATVRLLFLPFCATWWMKKTSKTEFAIFCIVYILLWINIAIYYLFNDFVNNEEVVLSYSEICVPFAMAWVMTLIICQIISTKPSIEQKKQVPKIKSLRNRRNKRQTIPKVTFSDLTKTVLTSSANNPSENNCIKQCKAHAIRTLRTTRSFKEETKDVSTNKLRRRSLSLLTIMGRQQDDDGFESFCGNGSRTSEEDASSSCNLCKRCNSWIRQVEKANKISTNRVPNRSKPVSSDSDSETVNRRLPLNLRKMHYNQTNAFDDTEDDLIEPVDLAAILTNSDECSYSSDEVSNSSQFKPGIDYTPTAILNPPSAKVTCMVWENKEIKQADLSMLDITSTIIAKVESLPESMDYFYVGVFISTLLVLLPVIIQLPQALDYISEFRTFNASWDDISVNFIDNFYKCYGANVWERIFQASASLQRCILSLCYFFLLSVAERTFKQRFYYAKLFSHLTSFRRAQKSKLPHFRLNKVINIKTWLSIRAYLKRRGPQRSIDVIVSTVFILLILLMSFLCIELLKDTLSLNCRSNIEALIWCFGLGIFLLRFLTLGSKMNQKYRNLSLLLTEQINLHLQIEQKPHKKEELAVANNVLKLAIDLLKELESPFKIIGVSANPILSNITKVVILSALSGVLSDMLGFKLKLHKIKIK